MKNKPGISIIIPCRNRPDQTVKTIKLLLNSEGWNEQFKAEIIVSDCTNDKSVKTAIKENFGDKIQYVRPERPGIATNKNRGAETANYPLLAFIDSDMEVEKDTLLSCLNYLETHPYVAGLTTNVVWRGNSKEGQLDRPKDEDRLLDYKNTTFTEFIYSRFKITYKEVFEKIGGYDERVFNMRGEGSDLSTRYWRAGFPLAYNQTTQVHHHETDDGMGATATHPEWGVAKDYFLLGYKYGNYENNQDGYFAETICENMEDYDSTESHFRMLQGMAKHYKLISKSKEILDRQKENMNPEYDFHFMEVFSDKKRLKTCINNAEEKLKNIRQKALKL